ncbi:unnamed protein product, partial [marine sediment metagenome]
MRPSIEPGSLCEVLSEPDPKLPPVFELRLSRAKAASIDPQLLEHYGTTFKALCEQLLERGYVITSYDSMIDLQYVWVFEHRP